MGLKKKIINRPVKPVPVLLMVLFSMLLSFATEVYLVLTGGGLQYENGYIVWNKVLSGISIKYMVLFFCVIILICFALYLFGRQIGSFVYRFRWPLGLAVIAFAVIFELSGSSIGMWQSYFTEPSISGNGVLIGQSRGIRSDEWAVHTPMTFSQYYSGFSVFGDILRGGDTDMYMVYGQPVMDWSIIFRPFQIGYLFLSPARGFSFYWVGKLVMLILVSFEMGMLITKKNKLLSLVYCAMMAFAPVVQWWFGANSFPDMLVYGQSIVLLVSIYMRADKYWKRILCGLGFVICGGAYLLVMYPAWQIPFFYVFLLLVIWVIIEQRKECIFTLKKDLPVILGSFVLLGVSMLIIVTRSWDTIKAVMNSAYPGSRMELGGIGLDTLFRYPGNLFLPFTNYNLPNNESEMSAFFDLFPLGIILSLLVIFKDKIKDKLLISLWIVQAFLGVYVVLGFPAALSKITLLSNSQAWRAFIALGFVNVLMLIRSLAISRKSIKLYIAIPLAAVLSVAITYYSKKMLYGSYFNKVFIVISILILFVLFAAVFTYHRKYMKGAFCVSMCLVMLMAGGLVNPVRKGLSVIEDNRLAQAVQRIQKEDGGLWIATDSNLFIDGNFLAMNGAPTINSTNTYPDYECWSRLDASGQYEEMYNRYAHVLIDIILDEPTSFTLENPDVFKVHLNINDIDSLGVKYVMSPSDLTAISSDECSFTLLFSEDGLSRKIYKVNYAE